MKGRPLKRIIAALFFFAYLLYNGSAQADAAASVIIEESTGRMLHGVNAHLPLPMASTTKVMTALVAIERCPLGERVTAGDNAYGVPGTSIYLEKGETLSLEEMLYGLMLASGNDAAVAIAEHVGGSVTEFCGMMNARAVELGCLNTRFSTPHGLPAEGHYTTASDLALIARQAMTLPAFRRIVSTQRATIPWESRGYDRVLNNKNRLLSTYTGALGIKTGYTRAAGRCLVFAAEREGMTLIGVVLACPDWFDEAERLLDSAFSRYEMARAYKAGEIVAKLPVSGGESDFVEITVASDVSAPVLKGETPDILISLPDSLAAGFGQGDAVGEVALAYDGETLCAAPLIALEGVPRATFLSAVRNDIRNWLLIAP